MKIAPLIALLAVGCVPNESPIQIGPVFPLTGTLGACNINSAVQVAAGELDVSVSQSYYAAFGLTSDLVVPAVPNANGQEMGNVTGNDFLYNSAVLTYRATPPLPFKNPETIAIAGVLSAGALPPTAWAAVNLIGPNAAQTIANAGISPGSPVSLSTTVQFKGTLRSGEGITSQPFTFPVTLYSTNFAGCGSFRLAGTGPCGLPPQDGAAPLCCVPNATGQLPTGC